MHLYYQINVKEIKAKEETHNCIQDLNSALIFLTPKANRETKWITNFSISDKRKIHKFFHCLKGNHQILNLKINPGF